MSLVLTSLSSYSISQDEISVNPDRKPSGTFVARCTRNLYWKFHFRKGRRRSRSSVQIFPQLKSVL